MATNPHPEPTSSNSTNIYSSERRPSLSPTTSSSSSNASSGSESEQPSQSRPSSRRSRAERPCVGDRQSSTTIIVPKGKTVPTERPHYPPDDARAMSPRRNSQDIEKLELGVRQALKEQAKTLQSSLAALSEKIDLVREDHAKLESENRALQDYIGGLTRTISGSSNLGRSSSMSAKKMSRR